MLTLSMYAFRGKADMLAEPAILIPADDFC
jgi:hypothetical protein